MHHDWHIKVRYVDNVWIFKNKFSNSMILYLYNNNYQPSNGPDPVTELPEIPRYPKLSRPTSSLIYMIYMAGNDDRIRDQRRLHSNVEARIWVKGPHA